MAVTADQDEKELLRSMLLQYGELLGGANLYRAFGFGNDAAFRRARERCRVPVPVFELPGRRGWFAATRDVALWIAEQRKAARRAVREASERMEEKMAT